jgi:hypothetical protein
MVYNDSHITCTCSDVTFIFVYPHAKFQVIPVSNVKDIRNFPILLYTSNDVTAVLFEYLVSRKTVIDMEKLSVSYSTILQVLLNKTINRIMNISFHKPLNQYPI